MGSLKSIIITMVIIKLKFIIMVKIYFIIE
jgi:hypothetical protein